VPPGIVVAVNSTDAHTMSKPSRDSVRLLAGLGVEGDVHAGSTVKHRSRVRRDPTQPNLRQVHLIHAELHDQLVAAGFEPLAPGAMGENVTTRGIDLLGLPTGTVLRLGRAVRWSWGPARSAPRWLFCWPAAGCGRRCRRAPPSRPSAWPTSA
jgi:hypothetical protein